MNSRTDSETAAQRQSYEKPTLTKYGQLKDLTTGGTGTKKEPTGSTNPNRFP